MNKQELIKQLTDLMATVQMAYFKGRMEGHPLWVHEHSADGASISIDLYNFGGDGKPVCDGLKPCTITYDDNTQDSGWLFCMAYDPDDDVTPLIFLFTPDGDEGDMAIDPEDVPEEALKNIIAWLQQAMKPLPLKPKKNARRLSPIPATAGSTSGTSGAPSARNTACMELPSGSMPNSLTITATCS